MRLSAGKLWSFRRLADEDGRFKMTAVDQRPPIMNLIKERTGVAEASYEDVAGVKRLLTRVLAPESSAMLLDPVWAYSGAVSHVRPRQGLLLTIEDHNFEETPGGRKSFEIPDWTVAKIKRLGGDGVKALAWYRPDADPAVCAHQQAFVERLGRACAAQDICFLLELLVYPLPGETPEAFAGKRSELVVGSLKAFTDPRFDVDLFKLESPVAAADIADPDSAEAGECQRWFDKMGRATTRPWVMLSAGADMKTFQRVLVYAYRAGASGYLAGRAIWLEAARSYPDTDGMERALVAQGLPYMREINRLTDELATPWQDHRVFSGDVGLAGAGRDFAANYAEAALA